MGVVPFWVFISGIAPFNAAVMTSLMVFLTLAGLGAAWYLRNDEVLLPSTKEPSPRVKKRAGKEFIPVSTERLQDIWHRLFVAVPGEKIIGPSGVPLEGVYFVQLREIWGTALWAPKHAPQAEAETKAEAEQNVKSGDGKTITCPSCGSRIRPMRLITGDLICPVCFTRLNVDEKAPSPKVVMQLAKQIAKKNKN